MATGLLRGFVESTGRGGVDVKYPTRSAGLTLIELLITVAILTVLAAVALPMYTQQQMKARRVEAKSAAMKLALAEEQYRSRRGNYRSVANNSLSDIASLGLDANEWDPSSASSVARYYDYSVNVTNGGTRFQVSLTPKTAGPQAGDNACTGFFIDQLGQKTASGTRGDACWR